MPTDDSGGFGRFGWDAPPVTDDVSKREAYCLNGCRDHAVIDTDFSELGLFVAIHLFHSHPQ